MNRMKHTSLLIIPLAISMLLSGCGTRLNEQLVSGDILAAGTTANNVSSAEYMQICENGNLSFWFNKDTTAFKVVDKADGYEWYSTANPSQNNVATDAPFTLSYVNQSGMIETMDAMTSCIADGQFQYERTADGMRVVYSVGDFSELLMVPLAITKERKDFLCDGIEDDFAKNQLDIMYQLIDLDRLDDANRETFLSSYPKLKDGPMYILRDSITASETKMKELSKLLLEAGYTEEMYGEDSGFSNAGENEKTGAEARFRICIVYQLTDNGLTVTVPAKEIQMNPSCPLVSIELHKYMASPGTDDNGFYLLPDGSGSLMNFHNGRGDLQDYNVSVYGLDRSCAAAEYIYNYDQAYLPVFAVKNGEHAIFSVIEQGDAIAEINAFPGNDRLPAYVAPTFNLRYYSKSYMNGDTSSTGYFVNVQKQRYSGDITIRHVFLNQSGATLQGMAEWYRGYLFGGRDAITAASPGLLVECVGQIGKQTQTAGIKHNQTIKMTSFEQVREIADELTQSGVSGLSVKMSGWFNGEYRNRYAGKLSVNKTLGSKKDFISLSDYLMNCGISFYPDADLLYTYSTAAGDGFSAGRDTATLVSNAKGYRIDFNPATFCRDASYITPAFINNPTAITRAFDGFFKAYDAYGIKGVSLRYLGRDLNGDYNEDNGADRQAVSKILSQSMSDVSKNHAVLTNGVNAYALPYADYCSDTPMISNERDNTDESVPFVEMVISGYIRYSGSALNLSGAADTQLLRMASVAADAYYVVSGENATEVRDSDYSFLYCSDFGYLKENMIAAIKEYQQKMSGLSGQQITGYQKLADHLYRTCFENGATVTVNYDVNDIVSDGITYQAKSYTVNQ